MRRAGGVYPKGVFEKSEVASAGRERPLEVRLRHADAERLLWAWGAAEMGQVSRVWYARSSAGFSDYQAPLDPEAQRVEEVVRRAERDDGEIARTGWVVLSLKPANRVALVRKYRDGVNVKHNALQVALAAFTSGWQAWSDRVDGPLNPL
jgi:hypothetical protein